MGFQLTSFFIGVQPCESNSSEAIDIDPNSFGGPSCWGYLIGVVLRVTGNRKCPKNRK